MYILRKYLMTETYEYAYKLYLQIYYQQFRKRYLITLAEVSGLQKAYEKKL